MKKIMIAIAVSALLASSASAYHMAVYEDAGTTIPEYSPHKLMTFY